MKNRLLKACALALALLLAAAALAEVRTTGNVWLREEPDKESRQITSYPENTRLEYLGETRVDDRGVAWYRVQKDGQTGWVSSRYSELEGEADVAAPAAEGCVEVSGYYRVDLLSAATALALDGFRAEQNSEVPYQYYNGALTIAGNREVEYIGIEGEGYSVFGVCVGMASDAAVRAMTAAGLDYIGGDDTLVFEHPAQGDAGYVNEAGHDSCVNLYLEDGAVKQIDWSSYTG